MDKRQLSTALAKYVVNPVTSRLAGYLPFWALLETTGRKSGEPRRTPVGNGLEGETFWLVAEHGRCANYIKNIVADPHVRVRVTGGGDRGSQPFSPMTIQLPVRQSCTAATRNLSD